MQTQKNIFYNVLLAISQVLFPLITFPYLARVLGPDNIGKLNFSETSTLARLFEEGGYAKVDFEENPDVFIINTCSVTENADKKCKQIVK